MIPIMRVHCRGFLLLSLLFVVSFCSTNADEQTFEVVGVGECADCKENNFKTNDAFSGLHVTIDCKQKSGEIKRLGATELDEQGKFKLQLPQEIIGQNSLLKHECYAQLHSAAAVPCPAHAHGGLETTKITFKSQKNGKFIFSPGKPLQFSTPLCTSKFLWSHFKYPPLPKPDSWKKEFPKLPFPPVPIYNPPPVVKPLPPPVPDYKPKPKKPSGGPDCKPKPKKPKKPKKPSGPECKPEPKPKSEKPKPSVPVNKPKPNPPSPLIPLPPIYKKPFPKKKLPKIPPKYFHHPKIGYFPPLPPSIPHP